MPKQKGHEFAKKQAHKKHQMQAQKCQKARRFSEEDGCTSKGKANDAQVAGEKLTKEKYIYTQKPERF